MTNILAIHDSHNASICEINNNNIIYFQEAERLDKRKKSSYWPVLLNKYRDKTFDTIIFVTLPKEGNRAMFQKNEEVEQNIKNELNLYNIKYSKFILEFNHHFFHACSAFFNSGFKNSYALIIDGNGAFSLNKGKCVNEIVSLYYFNKNKFKEIFKVFQSDDQYKIGKHIFLNTLSLGNMYTTIKHILNFKEEGSVMGLSSYVKEEMSFAKLFTKNKYNHFNSIQSSIHGLVQQRQYKKTIVDKNPQFVCKLAQTELENIVLNYVSNIMKDKQRNICVSGGVFQNTVLNSKILNKCLNLYVDPFADDSGLSMGAALWYSNKNKFYNKKINNLYLGDLPDYKELPKDKLVNATAKEVAEYISKGNIVAIYQGRNELGKRALGNRSFLFDPRDQYAKDKINILKNREWFRPTAGTILHEHADKWFDLKSKKETPFMSYVFKLKKQNIPGITHIDNTCRIQTLKREDNFHYYNLINEFYKITGVPVLGNTSFNLAGEPLVNSVDDAIHTLTNCNGKFNMIYFPEIGKICFYY